MFAVVFLMMANREGMLTPRVHLSQYASVLRELDLYVSMGHGTHELEFRMYPMLHIQGQLELRLIEPGRYWLLFGLLVQLLNWQPVGVSPAAE